jgi:predicted kinase
MSFQQVKTIYMPKGVPASGKTTWAREKVRDDKDVKRVSKDDMRDMLDNGHFSMKNEGYILDMRNEMVESALLRGYDVIVDDTNFSNKHWRQMCEIAKRVGNVRVVEIYFSVKLKEALQRNRNREKDVPGHVIENMFQKHVRGGVDQRDEFFSAATHPHGENRTRGSGLRPAIIVDMDGTLCINNSGRSYFDYDRVIEDDPNMPILRLVNAMKDKGYKIVVVTGRKEKGECRKQCEDWLDSFEVPHDELYLRGEDDNRSDDIVKKEIYFENIHDRYNVEFVVDDRMSVTNMWRSMGIPCLQVAKGTF